MSAEVERVDHRRGRHGGHTTLVQTFRFPDAVGTTDVAEVLRSAPFIGPQSIFGDRRGAERPSDTGSRRLSGFSPAPGFRFDVELTEPGDGVFVVSFSQPARTTPHLDGSAVWWVRDDGDATVLHEEINTAAALEVGGRPLAGSRPSLRRWLFFRVGHPAVMRDMASRLAVLATEALP